MPAFTLGGLFTKLRPPAEAGSDAALLDRFAQTRDSEAFAELVRRHGAMVLAVCRRVLGDGPDAEDAHQIAFMALARDAGRIADPHALSGWLYRVAWLTARKLAGRVHRRKPEPLTTEPTATTMPSSPENDVRAVIDEELLALPERFRAVAVMCLVEGRTNTEAAGLLGIPKGTVDSRLSTAKAKLRERLLRRGVAAAALLTVEQLLTSETSAAATRAAALAANAITVALDYAAGVPTAGTEHLIHTANGVRPVTRNLKWLAALMFTTALMGGGGVGVYMASAAEKDKQADAKKPDEKKPLGEKGPPAEQPKADKPGELKAEKVTSVKAADDVQKALALELKAELQGVKFEEVLAFLENSTGATVRIDTPSFVRRGWGQEEILDVRTRVVNLHSTKAISTADLLREALGQASPGLNEAGVRRLSYRIKGGTILIVPEYQPPSVPGSGANGDPVISNTTSNLLEDMYGEPVTVRYKDKLLAEVIDDLQERTGANIVLGRAGADNKGVKITANFNDTRLLTVLKIVGDMCEIRMKPVVMDNVFYLTDASSAEEMQKEVNRDLFSTPPPPVTIPAKPEAKKEEPMPKK